MLDIKVIREQPDQVKQNCVNKNTDPNDIDRILELDGQRRNLIQETEDLKSKRNTVSQDVAKKKKAGEDADDLIKEMRGVGDRIKELDEQLRGIEEEFTSLMMTIPNIAHESVPIGKDENDNVEVRRVGELEEKNGRVDHIEISSRLGILDFQRGAKVTGTGFGFYIGKGARLERALWNYFLDTNTTRHGFTEIIPPVLANSDSLRGTAQLPKSEEDMYFIEKDDLYLIPTAEVPLTNFHRNDVLSADQLPVKYAGYSPCFRREAGSYGKDTRGFLRVHQFNKIELVKFTKPEDSYDELEEMVGNVESLLTDLGLTYRVITLCTGDMTFGGSKTYDLEVWSPAEQKWLEVSSCTNFEDFQGRRANIRFKPDPKAKPQFVHTLNGSGIATSRIMVALLEQYQKSDGTVEIPEVLRSYTGFDLIEPDAAK